jgi:hypothetical protein
VDLRESGHERATIDMPGPEPLVTIEPVPAETVNRRWLPLGSNRISSRPPSLAPPDRQA